MKNRIFADMRTIVIGSTLLCCLILLVILYGFFDGQRVTQVENYLRLLSASMDQPGMTAELAEGILDAAANDVRVTHIAADGIVLYESQADSDEMENHLEREEVREALATGNGAAARMSSTLSELTLYRARRLTDGTVLRISLNTHSLLGIMMKLLTFFGLAFFVTGTVSILTASGITEKIVAPINRIDLKEPLKDCPYEELRPLLMRISDQNNRIGSYMAELAARSREFEAITGSMSEGLVVLNDRAEVLAINAAAKRIFRTSEDPNGILRLDDRTEELSFVTERALNGDSVSTMAQRNGRFLRFIGSPVRSEGTVTGVVLLTVDVNDAYLAEKTRREFTANVSHELKTPVTAVLGYSEIMKNGIVPEKDLREFAGRIYDEAQRLKQLVEDTLHLSRLDENYASEFAPVELNALAKQVCESLSEKAAKEKISLAVSGEEVTVEGEAMLLNELLMNLADNAVKYNRPGGSVTISTGVDGGRAYLSVADTGIGIPEEYRDRVFERFFRVDKSRSREAGGTGLGLSIVKHVALMHRAKLEMDSKPGEGTTITVRF